MKIRHFIKQVFGRDKQTFINSYMSQHCWFVCENIWHYFHSFTLSQQIYKSTLSLIILRARIQIVYHSDIFCLIVCLFVKIYLQTHLIIDHIESKYTDGIASLLAPATVVTIHHAVANWAKELLWFGKIWNQLNPIETENQLFYTDQWICPPLGKISHIGLNVLFRSRTSGGNLRRKWSQCWSYMKINKFILVLRLPEVADDGNDKS